MKATGNVLIIDDELDICYLVSSMLKQRSLRPSFVNTLADATSALKAEAPSLIFLDNHLPDGFGLEFIPFIKANYPDVKIIMITAHDGATERSTAHRNGVDLFIAKPLTRKLINDAVDKLLDPSHSENSLKHTRGL